MPPEDTIIEPVAEAAPVVEAVEQAALVIEAVEPIAAAAESQVEPAAEIVAEAAPIAEPEAAPPAVEEPAAEPAKEPTSLLAEAPAEPEPLEPISYEPFTLPEDAVPDKGKLAAFTEILGSHRVDQETAQKLVDMHVEAVSAIRDRLAEYQQDVWRKTNEDWMAAVRKDPQIGGNRLETVLTQCGSMISRYASSERDPTVRAQQASDLREALNLTGAGNNPAIVRWIANMAEALSPPRPIAAPRPMSAAPASKASRRYSNGHANA